MWPIILGFGVINFVVSTVNIFISRCHRSSIETAVRSTPQLLPHPIPSLLQVTGECICHLTLSLCLAIMVRAPLFLRESETSSVILPKLRHKQERLRVLRLCRDKLIAEEILSKTVLIKNTMKQMEH